MTYLVRRLTFASGSVGLAALLFQPLLALGQAAPPAPAASAADPSVSDRVKKDAAGPLYWIRLNAQKTDPGTAKPAPRIVEVKPAVAAAPRPAPSPTAAPPAAAVVATNVSANTPASTGGAGIAAANAASSAPIEATATLSAPPPLSLGGSTAGVSGSAGLAAPSGAAAATEAARAATAPVEEPDDQPLALVQASEPEFPTTVMRRLRKGNVQVRFEVQPDGSVANPTVVQTTNRTLNEAALEAVTAWRFQPVRAPRSAVVDLGFDLDS